MEVEPKFYTVRGQVWRSGGAARARVRACGWCVIAECPQLYLKGNYFPERLKAGLKVRGRCFCL